MYNKARSKVFRPNTKKIYEEHHGVKVPRGYSVHHILPVRLGGTHDISNLEVLDRETHVFAHIALYQEHGDIRDLCASYMLRGLTHEARKLAAAKGGAEARRRAKEAGVSRGFGAMSAEWRSANAAQAGKIGGTKQRELGLGIHKQTREERLVLSSMGGKKGAEVNGWNDPAVQSENGKRGGVKNKGFKWCHNDAVQIKYTAVQQAVESFEDFIVRTNMRPGMGKSQDIGSRFYNDGMRQWMFSPLKHLQSFEEFIAANHYNIGRIKK